MKGQAKKRIAKKITKDRLDEYLALIGWSTCFHGANHWAIYNHHKKRTGFSFLCDRNETNQPLYNICLEGYNSDKAFGGGQKYGQNGTVVFTLRNCVLEAFGVGKEYDCVSIVALPDGKENGAFVSFYNHEKK